MIWLFGETSDFSKSLLNELKKKNDDIETFGRRNISYDEDVRSQINLNESLPDKVIINVNLNFILGKTKALKWVDPLHVIYFISELLQAFHDSNKDITVVYITSSITLHPQPEKFFLKHKNLQLIDGDIRNIIHLNKIKNKIDSVVHLAAINGTRNFYEKPNLVLEVGIKGIINIIDFCKIKKIKEIFLASSSEVYQNAPIYPTDEKVRLIIPDPHNPRFSYSSTKIISEILILNSDIFKKAVIFRPHNVYGPDMGFEHVLPQFVLRLIKLIKNSSNGKVIKFPIQGNGTETRSFIYIDDFIEGVYLLYEKGEHLNIYNIGTEDQISIEGLAKQVAQILNANIEIVPGDLKKGSTNRRCPDISKIKNIGFSPKTYLPNGIEKLVNWYLKNYKLIKKIP